MTEYEVGYEDGEYWAENLAQPSELDQLRGHHGDWSFYTVPHALGYDSDFCGDSQVGYEAEEIKGRNAAYFNGFVAGAKDAIGKPRKSTHSQPLVEPK